MGRERGREGKVEEVKGCPPPQLGSLNPVVEEGEGEKGKEESLGWGVQALLFSTLSTHQNQSVETD